MTYSKTPTHRELLEFPILMEVQREDHGTILFETIFERPTDGSIWSARYWRTPDNSTNTLAEGLCPIVLVA